MTHLFYFFIIFGLWWEYYQFAKAKEARKIMKAYRKKNLLTRLPSKPKQVLHFLLAFHLMYSIWSFVGLFSSQWIMFIPFILIGLIPKNNKPIWYVKLDALIAGSILLFILLNKYHLHIDLLDALF